MKKKLFTAALALAVTLVAPALQAQNKIAVINMKTVFDGYWKTKQSDTLVKERQSEFQKNRSKMLEDYQKANEEYKNLSDLANDPALSLDEQKRRRQTAETKLLEIREIEQSISNLDKQFQSDITEQVNRMRQNILRDIQDEVDTQARAAGLNLVFDVASESVNRTPIIMFNSGLTDITQPVLQKVNENAPPGALDAAPAATPAQ
ncbi:MAG: OmpH family outer membrane protein [Verrucomicrobiales bacterium]|nr:OmpH family outer membrane protein [Verrucomicrobiales bacterium]